MALIGSIEAFNPRETDITSYMERIEMLFACNEVTSNKKVSLLLTLIGGEAYGVLKDLLAPTLPSTLTFERLSSELESHYSPKRLVIAERYKFYSAMQETNEDVKVYVARLKNLAKHCAFGTFLNEALRDKLVCGIRSEIVQRKLLTEDNLTFERAFQIATSVEMAEGQIKAMGTEAAAVNKVSTAKFNKGRKFSRPAWQNKATSSQDVSQTSKAGQPTNSTGKSRCGRCLKIHWDNNKCPAINWKCYSCNQTGHTAKSKWCKNRINEVTSEETSQEEPNAAGNDSSTVGWLKESEDTYFLNTLRQSKRNETLYTQIPVEGKTIVMEVDSGACKSVMHINDYKKLFPSIRVESVTFKLRVVTGEKVNVIGQITVSVEYQKKIFTLPLVVIDSKTKFTPLLGRNWLDILNPQWRQILDTDMLVEHTNLNKVFTHESETVKIMMIELKNRFRKVFEEEPEAVIKHFKAEIKLKDDAKPIFHRAYSMPYALKLKVEDEVAKMVQSGIVTKVAHRHRIDSKGVHPLDDKVKSIHKAPSPQNITQLKSYLGLLNYYGKFIPMLSAKLRLLYDLCKSGVEFQWSDKHEQIFQFSKKLLTSDSVLVHFNPNLPVYITCDASSYGVGAVLSHEVDHRPLQFIFGRNKGIPVTAAARITRWALALSAYEYEIEYKPSKMVANADGLSRLPLSTETEIAGFLYSFNLTNELSLKADKIAKATTKDTILAKVIELTLIGWPNGAIEQELKPYFQKRHELSVEGNCLLIGTKVVIPTMLRSKVLSLFHEQHVGIVRTKMLMRTYCWWPGIDEAIEKFITACQWYHTDQITSIPPAKVTPSSTTGISPAQGFFKMRPRTRFDLIKPSCYRQQSKNQSQLNKNKTQLYTLNQTVFVKNIRSKLWQRGTVIQVLSYCTYLVQVEEGIKFVHANDIRPNNATLSTATSYPNKLYDTNNASMSSPHLATTPVGNAEESIRPVVETIVNNESNRTAITETDSVVDEGNSKIESPVQPCKKKSVVTPKKDSADNVATTRSGRIVKPPSRLNL
ncbi:uncharacterized protein LOC112466360 [Temnothorax curvispinosus]|uniref:RNA-directed DNA polymerase n=1 Tax=Temnothorax curvispinosus TaxID=300111 RepID=A0A6J1RBA2_9HYME|nr:uncharacterized protein LOC112466360 [Temnothorax curvispinosus]